MRRNALSLSACGVLVVLSGCGLFNKKPAVETTTDPYANQDYAQPTGGRDTLGYAPVSNGGYDPAPIQTGSRYHTVQKKDTLYSLARQYYGDAKKWRDIYEANRAEIGDPNKIKVGQRLMIP